MRPLLDSDEFLEASYDFKSRLQEIAAETGTSPSYLITESGLEHQKTFTATRSEERRVGKKCRSRRKPDEPKEKLRTGKIRDIDKSEGGTMNCCGWEH